MKYVGKENKKFIGKGVNGKVLLFFLFLNLFFFLSKVYKVLINNTITVAVKIIDLNTDE